jgi:hypothetical protein
MIAVVRDRIPVGLLSRLRFPQRDLKPGVLCSIKGAPVGRCDRELQDIGIPDRVRGHREDMAHRHDEVISHRMQVGVMRVGWFAIARRTSVGMFVKETELGSEFDDQATKAMGEAFEAACKVLDEAGQSSVV